MLLDHQLSTMKISLPRKPDLIKTHMIVEKLRNERNVEHLYLVKQNVAYLWFEGYKNYVFPQPEQLIKMQDAIVLHNHIAGTSFSYEDIDAITKYNAKELMVICKSRTYSVKRSSQNWPFSFNNDGDIEQYRAAFREANNYIDSLVEEGKMEESERNDFINHITWKLFFPRFDIEYKIYGL